MRREKRKGRTFEYEPRERRDERRNEPTRGRTVGDAVAVAAAGCEKNVCEM